MKIPEGKFRDLEKEPEPENPLPKDPFWKSLFEFLKVGKEKREAGKPKARSWWKV